MSKAEPQVHRFARVVARALANTYDCKSPEPGSLEFETSCARADAMILEHLCGTSDTEALAEAAHEGWRTAVRGQLERNDILSAKSRERLSALASTPYRALSDDMKQENRTAVRALQPTLAEYSDTYLLSVVEESTDPETRHYRRPHGEQPALATTETESTQPVAN